MFPAGRAKCVCGQGGGKTEMENYIEYGYVGLAVISFLAATILPVGSEVFFMAMIAAGYPAGWCLWWASLGNTLGGMTNYYLGRLGKTEWLEKHLKFSAAKMAGVQEQLRYKGALSAFFSFLPAVGDVIPFVLGYMRASGSVTAAAMFAGKLARYALLVWGTRLGMDIFQS